MVYVLAILAVGLALGAATLAETLSSRSHATLDARQRRALQAADFGVQAVLYHQNELNIDSLNLTGGSGVLGKLSSCVVPVLSSGGVTITGTVNATVTTEGVSGSSTVSACPVAQGEGAKGPNGGETFIGIGNHDGYAAEFVPGETVAKGGAGVTFNPKIISIGRDDNGNTSDPNRYVYARVEANLAPVDPFKTVEANNNLEFQVTGATAFNGTARAGHNVIFEGTGAFAGTNILGSDGSLIGPTAIDYGCERSGKKILGVYKVIPALLGGLNHVTQQSEPCSEPFFKRPPITISPSKPDCTSSCLGEPGYIPGNQNEIFIKNETREVELTPGQDYVLCSFYTNGPVTVPTSMTNASKPVRIFIDSPSSKRCEKFAAHENVTGAGNFVASKGIGGAVNGSLLSPTQIQIYIVGNGTSNGTFFQDKSVSPTGNGFFLYAPTSKVEVESPLFAGNIIGYDVAVSALTFTQNLGIDNYPLAAPEGVFRVTGYTQCPLANTSGQAVTKLTTTSASADASGC
jgi:hypothetical protein